jgi:Putative transposase
VSLCAAAAPGPRAAAPDSEGEIWLTLRHRWADGTTHLRFDPLELLERLAVLTPRPRANLILYYGVLAPRAARRAVVVPAASHAIGVSDGGLSVAGEGEANRAGASRSGGYQWAELMRRTFGLDVLACTRCGGRLRLVALIEQVSVVQRILRHLGLPTELPEPRPARSPPRPFDATDDQFLDVPEWDAAW